MSNRSLSKLGALVVRSMGAGLAYARGALLDSTSVDGDVWQSSHLTREDRDALLTSLLTDRGLEPADLAVHLGEEPIPADRKTHAVMAGLLRRHAPTCFVVGEEAREDEWQQAIDAKDGSLIITLDPIDGSVPYSSLTFGYSSNVLAHKRWRIGDSLEIGGVANSSGITALWDNGNVFIGDVNDMDSFTIAAAPLGEVKEGSVAVLGALPRHRARIRGVLENPGSIVFTTAGAPASLGLVAGSLESLVATTPQTLHDAAFLPALAALHLTILTEHGESLGQPEVLALFSRVARDSSAKGAHPCPAFVASRSPEAAHRLRSELGWGLRTGRA